MSSKSNSKCWIAALALGAILLPLTASAHIVLPPRDPDQIGRREAKTAVADFQLIDQDGKLFQFSNSRGKVVLGSFIFTTCPDVCPFLTSKLAAIQRVVKQTGNDKDLLLLSITTDPERDSSAALREYGRRFKADFRNWKFLTGSRQNLAKVWKIFGLNVTKTQAGDVQHTT
ncbi:MAG: SCO family protein, partial [Candidatus Binatia bacterium]